MPNRTVLSERPDDEAGGPLSGPAAYEQGLWWLRQAASTNDPAAAQIASAYFTAANAAVAAQSLVAGGLLSEENGEDWELVIGS